MNTLTKRIVCAAVVVLATAGVGATYTIPSDQVDGRKLYWGSPEAFEKPGEIDLQKVITETPEYKEIKKKKVERGTGKYWILMSQASERALKAVAAYGKVSEYDLIAASGYLGALEPAIPADDVTEAVTKALTEDPGGEDDNQGNKKDDDR